MRIAAGIIAASFLCVAVPAQAQSIGLKLGGSFSKYDVSASAGDDQESMGEYAVGGFFRFKVANLPIQLEAIALTKGTQGTPPGVAGSGRFKVTYFEVPLTVLVPLGNGPYVFAGPTVGFETGCKYRIEGSPVVTSDCDDDTAGAPTFQRKETDFGVTAGAGWQVPLAGGAFLLEGRGVFGLTNLNDAASRSPSIKNRSIVVFAGFAVPI